MEAVGESEREGDGDDRRQSEQLTGHDPVLGRTCVRTQVKAMI